MLGHSISETYKQQLKETQKQKERQALERKRKKQEELEEMMWEDSDEHFAFIAGYTSGGAPFGITWEEWDNLDDVEVDEPDEPLSDDEFYNQLIRDSIELFPYDMSRLDGENVMIIDSDSLKSLDKLEYPQTSDLDQLFEFFIQWKAGNLSAEDLRDIISEAVE